MTQKIEGQLIQMIQTIMINVGRAYEVQNLDILLDYSFYFEVCPLIFPQFNIQIIKIGEDEDLNPEQKMQNLIQLLGKKLQIDISALSGQQLLKGHFFHMYKMLRILHQFSEAFIDESSMYNIKKLERHQSQPILPKIQQAEVKAHSVKFSSKLGNISNSISVRSIQKQKTFKSISPELSGQENIIKSQILVTSSRKQSQLNHKQAQISNKQPQIDQQKQNIQQRKQKIKKTKKIGSQVIIVNVSKDKKNSIKPMKKSIRKNNISEIKLANKKFKSYLQNYMGNPKANKKRNSSQIRPKSAQRKNIYKEIEEIDNFFKSFSYRLRDQKEKYLKRMQQIIRTEENSRIWTNEKRTKQENKTVEKRHLNSINKLNQCHQIRLSLVKEQMQNCREGSELRKKQHEKKLRERERELRDKKKKESRQIKNYIQQLNNKALMKLEEGGKFEKMIFDMYKKH